MSNETVNGARPAGSGVDEATARIVDLAQRREARDAAAAGLVAADIADAETVAADAVLTGEVIDPPGAALLDTGAPARVPVLPSWLTSRAHLHAQVRRWGGEAAYLAAVHTVRLPVYAGKVAWYAPQGAYRLAGRVLTWTTAEDGNWSLRQDAANRNDSRTFLELDRHRMRLTAWRWWITGFGTAGAGTGGVVLATDLLPWWVRVPVAGAALLGLARYGRPLDAPILERTIVRARYRKLTAELTRKGIMATGLVKRPEDITFAAGGEIRRDGPGYLAIADLPDGVIAVDVVERREKLAGGLRLPMDQVWPEVMPREHPGRLALWVADRPVSAMKQPAWPLLKDGTTDYFTPFVYGFDPRMRPVMYRLDERNSLFAGFPGSGKSLSARVVMSGGALDPLVTFAVFDLAGRGDFDAFEPLCAPALFGSGADDGTKQRAYQMLMWLLKECDTRGPLIKRYATQGLNTENKLNRAIAQRDARLRPILASIDEVQELITDPELGKAAAAAMTSIVKRGRALGIHLLIQTQRIDKDSLPKGVTSNIALRTCLAVPSHTEVDLALGTGAYNQGARPNHFEIGVDAGWGVRVGYGPLTTVRAAYLDRAAVEQICARALRLRGGAVADVEMDEARDVLADVLGVLEADESGQHWDTLAARLADRHPQVYSAMTADALSAMVRGLGLESRNVKVSGEVRRGVYRAQLVTAIDERAGDSD
ncbi:S-DNA-T family DNA segregation ATPase FtsK/SpoIIIE [Catenuloplanes nepalensis]|uniref:S-DNA-T family DNA segregation ATPase FtsK/SpoIIIE n=1 Tax=Catenuloplanes nepalensis TaxID=587533 RepID=A0ABT9N173_9ACTN|nr:FtsK/SpoIIIE domain-containing protein [Catenuloplanes nepalensis]MDP9797453.1 S-DNA-T family DNA segregation ATPase FtsK/SpoIIIE [Catenuloplanes nepalensis]